MISVTSKGSFKKTEGFLRRKVDVMSVLDKYGQIGVDALSSATPVDTGDTARSWYYQIVQTKKGYAIVWHNSHTHGGTPVAILIQYGHATGNGGHIEGRDFINPAIQPVFDQIANDVWKVVTST